MPGTRKGKRSSATAFASISRPSSRTRSATKGRSRRAWLPRCSATASSASARSRPPAGRGRLGLGPGNDDEPGRDQAHHRDRQQDQHDDHVASLADPDDPRPLRLGVSGGMTRLAAMRRALPLALAALVAAPVTALAQGPVTSLPPARSPAVLEVAPGIGYQRLVQGAQVIDIVRAAPSPRIGLAPAMAAGSPVARGSLSGAVTAGLDQGVVAGMNGDFFSYTTGAPSGALLIGGDLIHEPEGSRPALVFPPSGLLGAATLVLQGRFQAIDPTGVRRFALRAFGGINRPPLRGSETILYTPTFGAATPSGGSRYEVSVRLDQPGPLTPNLPRTGTVVAAAQGGGMAIAPGTVVLTGVGSAGPPLVSEFPLGQQVALTPGLLGLPAGALNAIGGGPALVSGGAVAGRPSIGYTSSQLDARTSRSAVGQTAAGALMLVTAEGPSQGSPGVTVAEQASLLRSLGAETAFAMDAGGSAQLALNTGPVVPWSSPRALADVLLLSYGGITLTPLPPRLSPNADHVDDSTTAVVRSPTPGVVTVTIARRTGRPTKRIWQAAARARRGQGQPRPEAPRALGRRLRGRRAPDAHERHRRDRAAAARDRRPHALLAHRALVHDRRRQAGTRPPRGGLPPAAPGARDGHGALDVRQHDRDPGLEPPPAAGQAHDRVEPHARAHPRLGHRERHGVGAHPLRYHRPAALRHPEGAQAPTVTFGRAR